MEQPRTIHHLPAVQGGPAHTMWGAVGHYLGQHRGHHVPLAALLRAPWRCLLNLAGGAVPEGPASASVRTLPVRTQD